MEVRARVSAGERCSERTSFAGWSQTTERQEGQNQNESGNGEKKRNKTSDFR